MKLRWVYLTLWDINEKVELGVTRQLRVRSNQTHEPLQITGKKNSAVLVGEEELDYEYAD